MQLRQINKSEVTAGQLVIVVIMAVLFGWFGVRWIENKRNDYIEDPKFFKDYTWSLIRQSIDACGNDQSCHRSFAASHINSSYSKENAEKIRRAMELVTSGEAGKMDRGLVVTELGPDYYDKLQTRSK